MEPLSWKPRAFLHHNFITADEADHIVALAKPFVSYNFSLCFAATGLLSDGRHQRQLQHHMKSWLICHACLG